MSVGRIANWGRRGLTRIRNKRKARNCVKEVHPVRNIIGRNDFILICPVINAMLFLPSFFRHYRKLGVRHFIMCVDARTESATFDALTMEPDVTVLSLDVPSGSWPSSHNVASYLLHRYPLGRWVLYVDVDEFFDYPRSSLCSLEELIKYMDKQNYTALHTLMLDRFNGESLQAYKTQPQKALSLQYPLYDTNDLKWSPYTSKYYANVQQPNPLMRMAHGGIMSTCFEADPLLMKHPLLKFHSGMSMRTHYFTQMQVADITGVLNHYRFVSDLPRRAKHFIEGGSRSSLMRYGALYQRIINEDHTLVIQPSSQLWTSVDALVEQSVLLETNAYRNEVQSCLK